jgi:hypothetical protein
MTNVRISQDWVVRFEDACALCGTSVHNAVQLDQGMVCPPCLRAIDADPRRKRQVMLSVAAVAW